MSQEVILRFDKVTFHYDYKKPLLNEVSFSVRENSKLTIMGQNGAGKSTIFKLLTKDLKPVSGQIHLNNNFTIGIGLQMVPQDKLDLSVLDFFKTAFITEGESSADVFGIEKKVYDALEIVNLKVPNEKIVRELSGGQKARLLLAYAIIQNPDLLLLDEPTNNLDQAGIEHLTQFLTYYPKTCIVISHDADFLNSFTDGVLYLDSHSQKVEQFQGNYFDVLEQIGAQIDRERRQNARARRDITDNYEKINFFKKKSAQMNKLAQKLEVKVEEAKENLVDMRRDDKTLPAFTIPAQHIPRPVISISEISLLQDDRPVTKKVKIELRKGDRLLITGPNGIGKSTLLKSLVANIGGKLQGEFTPTETTAIIDPEVKLGYYSQDFSELDFNQTPYELLLETLSEKNKEKVYATAAKFLLPADVLNNPIGSLSEGQKGLLCYARFTLLQPGLLILDEPTNHINFRHIPVIADALEDYAGTMILVSHVPDFVEQIDITEVLGLEKLRSEQ